MAKKTKKVARTAKATKSVKVVKHAASVKRADSKKVSGPAAFLFRRYDNNIAFTLIVSCAAYALFMAVSFVLHNTESLIAKQEQQIAAMNYSIVGQVAGVSTSAEK